MNYEYPSLTIIKVDDNGNPLVGARFMVSEIGGSFREEVTTGQGGIVSLVVPVGTLEIAETRAPTGFVITEPARTIVIRAGEHRSETFVNHRIPGIVIEKVDESGNPLMGAEFEVRTMSGTLISRVTTNQGGTATIAEIAPGTYQVIETRAPQGFVLDSNAQIVEVRAGDTATLRFVNRRQPSLIIEKHDTEGNPLANAVFEVKTLAGTLVAEVTTGNGGTAIIPEIVPGAYQVLETRAPQGFVLDSNAQIIEISAGQTATVRFVNHRQPSLTIEKVDENGLPLAGAEFEVRRLDGGLVTRVTSNSGGVAIVESIDVGSFEIIETRAPAGFVLDQNSQIIEIVAGQSATVRFINHRQPSLIIEKLDPDGRPLAGAVFEVRRLDGGLVSRVTSNQGGLATIAEIEPGSYEVREVRAPDGFVLDQNSQVIEIIRDETVTLRFINVRYAETSIRKISGDTGLPLAGVVFSITGLNGERIRNPIDRTYEFATDRSGMIHLPFLPAGVYVATEIRALPGYGLAPPQTFEVIDGQNTNRTKNNGEEIVSWVLQAFGHSGIAQIPVPTPTPIMSHSQPALTPIQTKASIQKQSGHKPITVPAHAKTTKNTTISIISPSPRWKLGKVVLYTIPSLIALIVLLVVISNASDRVNENGSGSTSHNPHNLDNVSPLNLGHFPVTYIAGVPTETTTRTRLALAGTVNPTNATNRSITWSIVDAGRTGATLSGNMLNTTSIGTVTVRATVINGSTPTANFTQDFTIAVSPVIGGILSFGDYEWRILDIQGNYALLLTENIITRRPYHIVRQNITWESSTIRQWLNNDFYDSFTSTERAQIRSTTVINNNNPWFYTSGGNNTIDKIFLLSLEEVVKYFGDSGHMANRPENAIVISDTFNSVRIARENTGTASWWWLRSPGRLTYSVARVYDSGILPVNGSRSMDTAGGVRPAIWLSLTPD